MQTKRMSIIESLCNVFSGIVIAFVISQLFSFFEKEIQIYIWSGFKWQISASSNAVVTVVLTVVSIIRGYLWRRAFNRLLIDNDKQFKKVLNKRGRRLQNDK